MNTEGSYSLADVRMVSLGDLNHPVEGMREDWEKGLIANCPKKGKARMGYLLALYSLRNSELPPAFLRSLPVARFQAKLNGIISTLDPRTIG